MTVPDPDTDRAHEEAAVAIAGIALEHEGDAAFITAGILDNFDRLAALLGYVKADGGWEYGVRRAPEYGSTVAWMPDRNIAESCAAKWDGATLVRQRVIRGPWEVVDGADKS